MIYENKVLMIAPLGVQGGMTTVVENYIQSEELNKKIRLKYIASSVDGKKINKICILISSLYKFILNLIFYNPNIIHLHVALDASIYRKGIFLKVARLFKKKVLLHFHASDLEDFYINRCNDRERKIVRDIFLKADKIISLNNLMQKTLKDLIGVDSDVLYNFTIKPNNVNYNKNSNNILMISRLTKDKGIYEAINIMKVLRKYGINLILAGTSDEIEEIKKYVSDNDLQDNIVFLGWVNGCKKEELFKDCFVSILPSYYEGVPMCILESLSYGVPVIASSVGGIPELLTKSEGYMHNPKDEKMMLELILNLYKNNNIKESLSNNCIKKFNNKFSEPKHIERMIEIYKKINM